MRTVLE